MKNLFTIVLLSLFISNFGNAQNVAINTDGSNASSDAILHLKSTSKGLLIPSMTSAQRISISNVSNGLMVYDTQTNSFWFRDAGFWRELITDDDIDKTVIEDTDGNTKIQVEESSNDNTIRFDINGSQRLWLYDNSNKGRLRLDGQLDINDLTGSTAPLLHFKAAGAERFSMGYNDDLDYFVIKDEVNNDQVLYIKDGKVGIQRSSPTNDFEINGTASKNAAGDWLANSDARLKKNITSLSSNDVLQKMLKLQGVTYEWDDDKTGNKRPEGLQYGFTAQNIQEVFPELVTEDNLGYLQTAYGTYDAMYVEAIRALLLKINDLESDLDQLKDLEARLNKLEASNGLTTSK